MTAQLAHPPTDLPPTDQASLPVGGEASADTWSPTLPRMVSAEAVVGCSAAILAVATAVLGGRTGKTSWHFFHRASTLVFGHASLTSGGGLAVYAVHPKFQFGPVAILAAEGVRLAGGPHELGLASFAMGALGPIALWFALDARRAVAGSRRALPVGPGLVVAATVAVGWSFLSLYAMHLDDALAITFALAALWGVATGSDLVVGVALGLAVASKPWAVAFVPLVLALPPVVRARAAAIALAVAGLAWLPFVAGDPHTASALGHFTIPTAPNSGLRALGIHDPATPSWDRAAQVLVGGAAAAWCARHGRWPAVLMAAAAIRLAIDPGTHRYYVTGLVAFVLAWELLTARWRYPLASLATATALLVPGIVHLPVLLRADLRLGACAALAAAAVVVPGPHAARSSTGAARRARLRSTRSLHLQEAGR